MADEAARAGADRRQRERDDVDVRPQPHREDGEHRVARVSGGAVVVRCGVEDVHVQPAEQTGGRRAREQQGAGAGDAEGHRGAVERGGDEAEVRPEQRARGTRGAGVERGVGDEDSADRAWTGAALSLRAPRCVSCGEPRCTPAAGGAERQRGRWLSVPASRSRERTVRRISAHRAIGGKRCDKHAPRKASAAGGSLAAVWSSVPAIAANSAAVPTPWSPAKNPSKNPSDAPPSLPKCWSSCMSSAMTKRAAKPSHGPRGTGAWVHCPWKWNIQAPQQIQQNSCPQCEQVMCW
jgi:hypothetical protein